MHAIEKSGIVIWQEVFFQILLHIILLYSFTLESEAPGLQKYELAFFLNYAAGALAINYFLIPRFFYNKKYLRFFVGVFLVVGSIIIVEEFFLERFYFADTRGIRFQGVVRSLLDVTPMIIILSGFKFAWDANLKQKEVDSLRESVHESELQYLKSQINPHFLFNNLNNLYSHAIERSPKTPGIILELSSVLRYMLYDCKEKFVPLSMEIEHLQNFTQLYELQIEDRGKVRFHTRIASTDYVIAPLILSVFLENAFKHSTASQSKDITIDVNLNVDENGRLLFKCMNSYDSQSNTHDVPQGIGLNNVLKRLELLYPNSHELNIRNEENMYDVSLKMQLKLAV